MSETMENLPPSPRPPKRPRRHVKIDRTRLPTPPPDPTTQSKEKDTDDKHREVLEYLESLHKSFARSESTFGPAVAAEEAFDHLERLYKLMGQMLELREQNGKLHRRIRDLEHLNNLEKLQRQLQEMGDKECPELDKDTAFAETILESILQDSMKDCPYSRPKQTTAPTRFRHSILRRNRSGSGVEKQAVDSVIFKDFKDDNIEGRLEKNDGSKSAKISKWTKVKAAFRWEKASNTVGDAKSQDSGIHVPNNLEIARYLRVPSLSDEAGHSPGDSGAGISTPGSLSTTSSNEDFNRGDIRSSEDENPQKHIPHHKREYSRSLSKAQPYSNKTPWSRMKGMIQHKSGSLKKKHRLSAASDDIQIDVELCSDNEDVFEDDSKSGRLQISSSPSPNPSAVYVRLSSDELPKDIVERYQRTYSDPQGPSDKKVSKWTRVKQAFINPESSRDDYKTKYDITEEEIQKNYRDLQKKLSLEFQDKITEWERLKQNSPNPSIPSSACGFTEDNLDAHFMKKIEEWHKIKGQSPTARQNSEQLTKSDLSPDFKKKLEEWEKIKSSGKCNYTGARKKLYEVSRCRSLSGNRSDNSPVFEYPVITDDFRKKLEEWKQIKASGGANWANFEQKVIKEKTPSPKIRRRSSAGNKHTHRKNKDQDKELHWFEKELSKIEKEKQRLERERQKFLEREDRLAKVRRSVIGTNKKEVLIHTASGFYRFEGISRKFAQRLYEWEKAQGIAPEASTFALLTECNPEYRPIVKRNNTGNSSLMRSKSADSVRMSGTNLACPAMKHQPSSLSLNDVEELEQQCLADSKSSSAQFLAGIQEAMDQDEPEAVLVEVEDYVEETAGPLQTFSERQQFPVYQRQEVRALCEGETIEVPKVRRSESTRAQVNYNLIEDIVNLLRKLAENEIEIKNLTQFEQQTEQNRFKLSKANESQNNNVKMISEKLLRLQEANNTVALNIVKEEEESKTSSLINMLDAVQDLSMELLQLVESLEQHVTSRNETDVYTNDAFDVVKVMRLKMSELRRHLSYVCAVSDLTAPKRRKSVRTKTSVHKTLSSESKESRCDTSENSRSGNQKEGRYIKSDNAGCSQGAIKKKIRYRQKSMQKNISDTDEDDEMYNQQKSTRPHKKLSRIRSISESSQVRSEMVSDESSVLEPKTIQEQTIEDTPVTIFVKTTRKLFTPIVEAGLLSEEKTSKKSLDDAKSNEDAPKKSTESEISSKPDNVTQKPPLPSSPVPQRKVYKEVSPSIRLIMEKYNQKIEQESGPKSGGSSGSNSPLWKTPVSERRVKAQTEKYQEEIIKLSPLLGGRREVQKSASVGFIQSSNKQVTIPARKNSLTNDCCVPTDSKTAAENRSPNVSSHQRKPLTLNLSKGPEEFSSNSSIQRRNKIQQAKEEFLKSSPVSAPPQLGETTLKFPERNRLSQISVESEGSFEGVCATGILMKSASAGMISADADAYRQLDSEFCGDGHDSLPRLSKRVKEGLLSSKYAFSNIASKFRKVKMRRGKDREKNTSKMNAVSVLCRQSLVVNLDEAMSTNNNNNDGDSCVSRRESSENTQGSSSNVSQLSKSSSWIKRTLFKKKEN